MSRVGKNALSRMLSLRIVDGVPASLPTPADAQAPLDPLRVEFRSRLGDAFATPREQSTRQTPQHWRAGDRSGYSTRGGAFNNRDRDPPSVWTTWNFFFSGR